MNLCLFKNRHRLNSVEDIPAKFNDLSTVLAEFLSFDQCANREIDDFDVNIVPISFKGYLAAENVVNRTGRMHRSTISDSFGVELKLISPGADISSSQFSETRPAVSQLPSPEFKDHVESFSSSSTAGSVCFGHASQLTTGIFGKRTWRPCFLVLSASTSCAPFFCLPSPLSLHPLLTMFFVLRIYNSQVDWNASKAPIEEIPVVPSTQASSAILSFSHL